MTKDLEQTLSSLGPEYGEMVCRMKEAFEKPLSRKSSLWRKPSLLAAATLVALLGGSSVLCYQFSSGVKEGGEVIAESSSKKRLSAFMLANEKTGEAISEIIRTQNPDGSWQTDYLTRKNANALSSSQEPAARLAYKKAMRNLRARGLL
jgi:hypothetical protein